MSPPRVNHKSIAEGTFRQSNINKLASGKVENQPRSSIIQRFVVIDVIPDPTILTDDKIKFYESEYGLQDHLADPALGINVNPWKRLPYNSIIGQQIIAGSISARNKGTQLLLPFFSSHIAVPIRAGEHVWVFFEDSASPTLGYWIDRIPAPHYVEDLNHTHAPRESEPTFFPTAKQKRDAGGADKYLPTVGFNNYVRSSDDSSSYQSSYSFILGENDAYERLIYNSEVKDLIYPEPVPRYKKRPGDFVIAGSNNTLISLQTDRSGSAYQVKTGAEVTIKIDDRDEKLTDIQKIIPPAEQNRPAGAIDIVAGRGRTPATAGQDAKISQDSKLNRKEYNKLNPPRSEGDPDFVNDSSRIYIAQKTDADKNLKIDAYNNKLKQDTYGLSSVLSDSADGDAAILQKSDKIRIIGRKDVQIMVTGFDAQTGLDDPEKDDRRTSITIDGATGEVFINSTGKVTIVSDNEIRLKSKKEVRLKSDVDITVESPTTHLNSKNVFIGGDGEPLVLGDKLEEWLKTHTHPSIDPNVKGMTGVPNPSLISFKSSNHKIDK